MPTTIGNFPVDLKMPGDYVTNAKHMSAEDRPKPVSADGSSRTEDLSRLKDSLAEHNISLKFTQDERTNYVVVKMIDENTGEEIRQFPTEVSLNLAANFIKLHGNFVNQID